MWNNPDGDSPAKIMFREPEPRHSEWRAKVSLLFFFLSLSSSCLHGYECYTEFSFLQGTLQTDIILPISLTEYFFLPLSTNKLYKTCQTFLEHLANKYSSNHPGFLSPSTDQPFLLALGSGGPRDSWGGSRLQRPSGRQHPASRKGSPT